MKKITLAALAAAAAVLPAAAHAQAYVQVETGLDAVDTSVLGNDEGVLYGVSAGYEVPLGNNLFAALEAGLSDSSTKECVRIDGERDCIKSGRDISATLRFGTNLSEAAKLYALGGYTNARVKATYAGETYDAVNLDGFRLGAGYQHNFGQNLFGKIEYRYSNYEQGVERHQGVVAIGAKF
ncbi:porin family protein [Caenibius sp. WL]|uniref:porin family protein n=1 Tax=Caenibius sp. WL TaxID=2872646 RepID=UPI001C99F9A4|nr:porin family protein [Caenibius sp. WL]QZP08348.1 porin family protein [Caenibius sp. WL]